MSKIGNSARIKQMASIVEDTFQVNMIEAQEIFTGYKYAEAWDNWVQGKGSAHMFVYYQKLGKFNPDSGEWVEQGANKELIVSEGESKLKGKGLYFLRITPPGKAIDVSKPEGPDVLMGEVHENTHNVMNTVVASVYSRFIDKLGPEEWGHCESEAKKEFQLIFSKFQEEMREAVKSLQQNLNLTPYEPKYQDMATNFITKGVTAKDHQSMVNHFEQVFTSWYETIEKNLDDGEDQKKDDKDSGPRIELDYWKNKMRKLTSISEQLKSKNCRTVYDVLNMVSSGTASDAGKPKEKIYLATSKWRSIELKVTEQLNEAKDNVKYLQTLEKFIEPLYEGDPAAIIETLPALMNSIKMIHTIARYYNTNERMTGLFVKITNMMIHNSKYNIMNFMRIRKGEKPLGVMGGLSSKDPRSKGVPLQDTDLWKEKDYPHDKLIEMFATVEELLKQYKLNYEKTRDRLKEMPKAKQFDFSEQAIFNKFELFCRRVGKLKELFKTISQFNELEKHNLENIEPIVKKFNQTVETFKKKNHMLLDYMNGLFDKDYVEFNVEVSHVEIDLREYINHNFDHVSNIEDSLKLLRKFRYILKRPMLVKCLYEKYDVLLHTYKKNLDKIEKNYADQQKNPPMVRNLPPVAGCITWSRHLIHRAMVPLQHFPKDVLLPGGKPVKQYNTASKISITLYSYELAWRTRWAMQVDQAKAGLLATLLVTNPTPEDSRKSLFVNFDPDILTLIREAKCLSRLGADIPIQAKIVLLQEEKFKMYRNELQFIIKEYNRIHSKIRPNVEMLLSPHKEDLQHTLRPGFCNLTWTSMNIDGYLNHVHLGLERLDQLIININDIMDNRIQNNLDSLSKTVLVHLPMDDKTYSLEDFVKMQEDHIQTQSETLKSKNFEVEDAVIDLINTINNYKMTSKIEEVVKEEIQKINRYYNWSMYQALLHATKFSLNQMKERICGRRNAPKQILKPFFEVDVHLDGPKCILKPSLEDVQSAINRAASHVLKSTKKVQNWNQGHLPEDQREPFYDWIAKDKEIVKVILLLTGSIQGTKNKVSEFLEHFQKYMWLWRERAEDSLKKFKATDPQLEDYENKLSEFDEKIAEITKIDDSHQIGALSLKTKGVKHALIRQIQNWKEVFSMELHKKAKTQLDELFDEIKAIRTKIEKPVEDDVDALGGVMQALEEIRHKQSNIQFQFKPIDEMYKLLENPAQESVLDKEEHDKIKKTKSDWEALVISSEKIREKLHKQQADFKKKLIENIGFFITDVEEFHENFMLNGPNDPKIAKDPKEAVNRLKFFTEEYAVRERKYISYKNGETLFGLPHMEYKNLKKVGDEITRLDKLYGLYTRVNAQIDSWQEIPWAAVKDQIIAMQDQVEVFERDCTKLPSALKEKQAFNDLKKSINDMKEILPLVTGLAKDSVKERHWLEIMDFPSYNPSKEKFRIPYDQETFIFKDILTANLLAIKDDVEDVTDQADKQARLEKQLNEEISAFWDTREFKFGTIVNVSEPCVITGDYAETIEKLEEHLVMLQQFLAMRYVKPFLEVVNAKVALLSETSETLEKWLKVQMSWQSLVSVFGKGDIAKAMPTESKIFSNVNKKWLKIMERASEQKNVVQCCQNDILKNDLPELLRDLDMCQKKLDAYLESKRQVFPRFYFCAAADLLKILSNGSDPNELQNDFEKLFDAINKVTFAENNKMNIKSIVQLFAGDEEELEFNEEVECTGNVEEWLGRVEKEMQRSVKARCMAAANDCYGDFTNFVNNFQSQFALLGLQMLWTTKVTAALEAKQKDRKAEFNKTRDEIVKIMTDLTALCLSDIKSKLVRTKIETLVTIHVHQRNQFMKVKDSNPPMKDANDFNWAMNTRMFKDNERNEIKVQITDVSLYYQYEFLGVKERLCITPLTDRCYLTLAQALNMNYGGAPAGPAGTGKTETVKDLGRTLGIFVVVTNCSPEHKMIDMAKIFKGLCMSGLWGCFDEFNRISLPTLSVVAAQIESMTTAKKRKMKKFSFPGEDKLIDMNMACGYFITMNPGYAGRQALPENLKVLFRGVTMMVPNRQIIIMVKLASVGYTEYETLSFKFFWLYGLSEEQLSAQRHYDFGLRNILSVLRTAGMVKREELQNSEEVLMARTLNDMNMSKFVFADKALFQGLIEDIFTNYKTGKGKEYKDVERELVKCMAEQNLENTPSFFIKMIQLYETSRVRHGFMVVGQAGCGKTTIYNLLTKALTNIPNSMPYEITRLNPKAFTGQQMYGCNNKVGEWEEGIFSNIWKRKNAKTEKKYNWIQADGPVDAIWIENLNTVLDDNRILTLANAERIPMSDLTKMTFEVENLNNASPATVSRCGIIYVSPNELGWEPLVQTWSLDKQRNKEAGVNWKWMFTNDKKDNLKDKDGAAIADYNWNWFVKNIKKYLKAHDEKLGGNPTKFKNTFEWCEKFLNFKMFTPEVVRITQLINLTEAVCYEEFTGNQEPLKELQFEKIFVYAFAWALAGLCDTADRQRFHNEILVSFKAPLPPIQPPKDGANPETVFDYYFDTKTRDWAPWAASKWDAPKKLLFSQLLIPTMDSTRSEFIMTKMARLPEKKNDSRKENNITSSLIVGGPGTAKTSTILMYLMKLDPATQSSKRINFSSATEPEQFQQSIDGEIEKQQSRTYRPRNNKQLTIFIDDFSMPYVNTWGDQVTLEITRQLMDQKGLYFLATDMRGDFQQIISLKFLAAMNHPGGGFNDVPNRIKRQFFSFNMPDPSDKSVLDIYGQILGSLVKQLKSDDVNQMVNPLIEATIEVWRKTAGKLLKTPSKFHYSFNIRELSRVFQQIAGVIQASVNFQVIKNASKRKEKPSQQLFMIGLWRHECKRTFYDKLVNNVDKKVFEGILDKATRDRFKDIQFKDPNWEEDMLMTDYLFANFQRDETINQETGEEEAAPFVYEACPDIESIRKRAYAKLERYNEANPSKKMNLVFFDDALSHLLRITRILGTPAGNALLVGVGGSGKQSLTKLASFIQWPSIPKAYFQITLTKTYGKKDLMENIKALFERSTTLLPETCFMLTDAEIKSETFLEAINSLLATGEIPGLLGKEERELYPSVVKTIWQKEMKTKEDPPSSEMWKYFLTRVKDNLHTVLAFSPVGSKFRERAQKFPSLFSQCSIDWFLPWPLDALVDVSKKFIGDFQIDCKKEVKSELITHMGQVHNMVTEVCEMYFTQFRRRVYVTPKSYLAFLTFYQTLYKNKLAKILMDESQINEGLAKLEQASTDINQMKKELAVKEEELKKKSEECNAAVKVITQENIKADAKAAEVSVISAACEKRAASIAIEKAMAQKDLDAAMPILEKANKAASGIKPNDITEIRANKKPIDIFKVVFDCVLIVFQKNINPITMNDCTIAKKTFPWYKDSYELSIQMLTPEFCKNLADFTSNDKDYINDETVELLEPYITLTVEGDLILSAKNARGASQALEGLCVWCEAMSQYQRATKIVKPKMQALEKASYEQQVAEAELAKSQKDLAEVKALQQRLQNELDLKNAEKQALQEDANATKKRMDQASKLINSLADNKARWEESKASFNKEKMELVGNVAKASAFVCYCGPFNTEFRNKLTNEFFQSDLEKRGIPSLAKLQLTQFLVTQTQVGEWALEGLPSDDLSIQNAIMVTKSDRFPLMIDPQGQARKWIIKREPELTEMKTIFTLAHPNLKEAIKRPLENGWPGMIENIENDVDPMFDPLLEKQFVQKGRKKIIKLADTDMDWDDKFRLYMTSRMANPLFSPELAAKTTIIDFTVTQGGLEQQLLGILIGKIEKQLEDQLNELNEAVTRNLQQLAEGDEKLLYKLANAEGSLLDDPTLIDVLSDIKTKAKEVTEKLESAKIKTVEINERREKFRPVAARGAVLYFCVVEIATVNWMYNTSLYQFLELFDYGIEKAPKASRVEDRVEKIIECLTYRVYRYINRNLFETDKVTFKIMICLKIMMKAGSLNTNDVNLLLKSGATITGETAKYNWMELKTQNNLKALSMHRFEGENQPFFKEIFERINRSDKEWRAFIEKQEPESCDVPEYEDKLRANTQMGHFIRLCLIRALREDRTLLASSAFIQEVLGDKKYTAPINDTILDLYEESTPTRPVLYLLQAGADPTAMIDDFAFKRKRPNINKVSMGEAQEIPAKQKIKEGHLTGTWLVLSNCQLSLELMAEMETLLVPADSQPHPDFRIWITCEPDNNFPLGLLQMAIKMSFVPPSGIKAGLSRTFNTQINPDFLERVEPLDRWKSAVFAVCFMHSIVLERRKFGPLGFTVPYEYNYGDMESTLLYIEKHMNFCFANQVKEQWNAIRYIACEVQYGGRITDNMDREMFNTYGDIWLDEKIFQKGYNFNPSVPGDFQYKIPESNEHSAFLKFVEDCPEKDPPAIFGLNASADLTFRLNQSLVLINTLVDVQPRESSGGSGLSREDQVKKKIEEDYYKNLPPNFDKIDVEKQIMAFRAPAGLKKPEKMSDQQLPLSVYLRQEIDCLQRILDICRSMMQEMVKAIDGEVVMTPELVVAIEMIYNNRVPTPWVYDATGVEIAWLAPGLGQWMFGLHARYKRLKEWLEKDRPNSFWITGFQRPQGFLTAVKQEVTRQNSAGGTKWALDEVEYWTTVRKDEIKAADGSLEGKQIKTESQGVMIHGLFMEGAQWNKTGDGYLEESEAKDLKTLYKDFPVMHLTAVNNPRGGGDEKGLGAKKDTKSNAKRAETDYLCPVYKYKQRTDKYLIFKVYLRAEGPDAKSQNVFKTPQINWKLKGCALLCNKE